MALDSAARCLPAERLWAWHEELRFYRLLDERQRRRLARLFPGELVASPTAPAASPALRVAWDTRARDLLGRTLDFVAAAGQGLDPVGELPPCDGRGAIVLTVHGSLVWVGPPDREARRSYGYVPLRRGKVHPVSIWLAA